MTQKELAMLHRIQDYAIKVMPDIDPQNTKISLQLEYLKPVMEEIAREEEVSLEDIFIQYMDLASELSAKSETQFQEELSDTDGMDHFSIRN